jgi:hypothetical protein
MLDRRYVWGFLLICLVVGLAGCNSPGLVSIEITPSTTVFTKEGQTGQLTAIGTFAEGDHPQTKQDITNLVTWKSALSGVATVSSTGAVTAHGLETTDVTANMTGFTGLVTAHATVSACQEVDQSNPTGCASTQ